MKKTFGHSFFWLALLAFAAMFACACSGDDKQAGGATEETQIAIEDKTVAGVSEKGPFTVGSAVHIYELEFETLGHTGRSIPGKIASDRGDFRFTHLNLECQFAFMEVSGYYRNENTGKQSTAPITLNALVDLSDKETANINLLTHLAFERTLFLVNEGKPVKDAKQQAEQEILKAFHIENELIGDFEGLSIFKKGEGNAALLAISSLMQADLAEGDFSERLANFAYDIEKDGVWNDSVTATAVADWASAVSLSTYYSAIRSNIKGWKISDIIPDFEKSMDKFWWENYGLGDCDKEREGVVKANTNALSKLNGVYFICKDNLWRLASDIEKDTYKWKAGKDGDVKFGDVVKANCYVYEDKVWRAGDAGDCSLGLRGCSVLRQDTVGQGLDDIWYICDNRNWRYATTYEKDTFGWEKSTDGTIKKGNVTDSIYVFDKTAWRVTGNVEAKLGGCVAVIADSVGKVDSNYFICKDNLWRLASDIEKDTYKWKAGKDGDAKFGDVVKANCYVYEDKVWRAGEANDCSLGLRGCTALRQDTVGQGSDKNWYKCVSQTWRTATDIEKDTATWGHGEFDGEVRIGQVNKNMYYIYETNRNAWREATALEYDTYQVKCSVDGKMFNGNVNTTKKYVCDDGVIREVKELELEADATCTNVNRNEYYILPRAYNTRNYSYYKCTEEGWSFTTEKLNKGTMIDERDGHEYKTIGIKSQMWMAENLNYADSVNYPSMLERNWCYENELDNCTKYGRLYAWAAVIDWVKLYEGGKGEDCRNEMERCALPDTVYGICPPGWHLPDTTEWRSLLRAVGGESNAGNDLRSQTGWENPPRCDNNCISTDAYGFSALPAGYRDLMNDGFDRVGDYTSFWSATQLDGFYNFRFSFNFLYGEKAYASLSGTTDHMAISVRCIKDEE